MRASVLGTGHCLHARAWVKVGRLANFRRQPTRQPACMHCMHKNRLNFSDLSSDHASMEDSQMGWSLDRFFCRSMTRSSAPRADSDIVRESQ
eukprot:COSAG05_NODE_47_length_24712_cov_26.673844_25_plen_92_part_00